MGRSSSSCLKIIACGSDTAESDDIDASQAKASGDKRGWSFRKRSGRHRVLGNNVSSETSTITDKEVPRATNTDFQASVKTTIPDEKSQLPKPVEKVSDAVVADEGGKPKISEVVLTVESGSSVASEESQISQAALDNTSSAVSGEAKMSTPAVVLENDENTMLADSKTGNSVVVADIDSSTTSPEPQKSESVVASENGNDIGAITDEPVAITIQTAVRGFLAQKGFIELKSVIALQAAIRGHLVRRNAVETLHCIRAIVKVQSLVRARSSKTLDDTNKPNDAQFSTVNLLKNSFARQLMESTPKPKSVNIRCDPLKPNSAWGWLERWMSVSKPEVDQKLAHSVEPEDINQAQEADLEADADFSFSANSKCSLTGVDKSLDNGEDNLNRDVNTIDSLSSHTLPTEVNIEQSLPQSTEITKDDAASVEMDVLAEVNPGIQAEPVAFVDKPAPESEQPKMSTKRPASEHMGGEEKKLSRKTSNPAFVAAQSKFEELSSAANSAKSVSSSHQGVGAESHVDTASSVEENLKKTNEPGVVETALLEPRTHFTGSECGTELSVSSTLDSPDRSDIGNAEAEQNKFLANSRQDLSGEANGTSTHEVTGLSTVQIQEEEVNKIDDLPVTPVVTEVSPKEEQKLETTASDVQTFYDAVSSVVATDSLQVEEEHELNKNDMQMENGSGAEHHAYKSSPEASPKSRMTVPESQGTPNSHMTVLESQGTPSSHMTVAESQGTPSSQVSSVKGRRSKSDKSGSKTKRNSLSLGKRSPSNPGLDSGRRISTEDTPKDHKSGKRRNSFGSTKSDIVDQEPRDSSSRTSLPSYMQATESARAKANSPRSSPDVHDKEVQIKKRHSLPGATGRQGSPRIQRSTSQAAEGAKANGSSERKWQR